ncbi:MAG: DUF3842 family protein [Planctomycetes bacterium]|nr:DUF3842 family protein [Planctomycetota bacterium]
MKIVVIDGQGGGIGAHIVKKLRKAVPDNIEIIALGTNALATAAMMKSGANKGASGENAIVVNVSRLDKTDYIMGTIGIITDNALMGELTPKMAEAIKGSPAEKLLLPLSSERTEMVGVSREPLPHLIDKLIDKVAKII